MTQLDLNVETTYRLAWRSSPQRLLGPQNSSTGRIQVYPNLSRLAVCLAMFGVRVYTKFCEGQVASFGVRAYAKCLANFRVSAYTKFCDIYIYIYKYIYINEFVFGVRAYTKCLAMFSVR